ncbi:MAG: hypothetical protein R2748_06220 [Bryobacterales bacterium]
MSTLRSVRAITRKWPDRLTSTVEMKLNYLRPAVSRNAPPRSRFVKTGKTLVVGTVDVTDRPQHRLWPADLHALRTPLIELYFPSIPSNSTSKISTEFGGITPLSCEP